VVEARLLREPPDHRADLSEVAWGRVSLMEGPPKEPGDRLRIGVVGSGSCRVEGRAMPAPCPRIRLRLTDAPLPDDRRLVGEGTLDQMRADLEELQRLGAQ
jgi:hypothetical protein